MIDVLYLLSVREVFDKYQSAINTKVLTKEAVQIMKDMEVYYRDFPAQDNIEWDKFESWFCIVRHSAYKQERLDLFRTIFSKLDEYVSSDTTEEIMHTLIKREYATIMGDEALSIADGTKNDMEVLRNLFEEYDDKNTKVTATKYEVRDMDSFEELEKTVYAGGNGLNWRMDCLNESLGPLRKGDLVVVAKRPETGGTTFCCSEASYMATQLPDDERILYFANEEAIGNLKYRLKQAVLGCESSFFLTDQEKADAEYLKRLGTMSKIQVIHNPNASIHDLREMVENLQPSLLVIDQLWKMNGFSDKGDVQRIGSLYNEARKIAQEFCPVMAIHQADVTAEDTRYIGQHQMHMSKTAVQGEADAIITIGAIDEPGFETSRFINIPKNKLLGGPHSNELMRHGKHEVLIIPERARFKG